MRTLAIVAFAALTVVAATASETAPTSIDPPAIHRASGVIEIDGTPHPYLVEGEGLPCIVAGIAPFYPPIFSDDLNRHIQFVYVDFKNTWMAEQGEDLGDVNMETLVDEIEAVRRALGFDQVCVTGHSAPGLVPLEYAKAYPEHVSHVIIIGTPPFLGSEFTTMQEEFWAEDASEERKALLDQNRSRLPDAVLESLTARDRFAMEYVRNGPLYWHDPAYDSYWIWAGRYFSVDMIERFFGVILADYDIRPELSRIEAPIFLALGRHDYAVPYTAWEDARDRAPGLSYHLFERSGHFPMLEERARFDRRLIAWLESS